MPADSGSLKVFISYSRVDTSFADELVAALAYDGRFQVTIDRSSIIEGEDWRARLGALIADADTIVFILSPSSAQSEICAWEVEEAYRLSKRILPVLVKSTGANGAPKRLAALNYVRFDPHDDGRPRSFMAGVNALVRALNTDVEWLREHTRYLTLAQSWDQAGRRDNRLLSGTDIAAAKDWAGRRPKGAPELTELHRDFIRASEEAEAALASAERKRLAEIEEAQTARGEALALAEQATADKIEASRRVVRRTVMGIVAALSLAIVAGGFAFYANSEKLRAERNATEARQQSELARKETERADKFINLVSSDPAGLRAMEKICAEATAVTSRLATAADEKKHAQLEDRFWELYYGPMYIIEIHQAKKSGLGYSKIETAMVMVGRGLKAAVAAGEPLPHSALLPLASTVKNECIEYLKFLKATPAGSRPKADGAPGSG